MASFRVLLAAFAWYGRHVVLCSMQQSHLPSALPSALAPFVKCHQNNGCMNDLMCAVAARSAQLLALLSLSLAHFSSILLGEARLGHGVPRQRRRANHTGYTR